MEHLLGIGELARRSGLTVSALRFYAGEGVLVPARVDQTTGYRRYSYTQLPVARALAGMRRVQLPLAEMRAVVEAWGDTALAEELLSDHLIRLELGLQDARREVATVVASLRDVSGAGPTLQVAGPALVEALEQVRYAVGRDPHHPSLASVLLCADPGGPDSPAGGGVLRVVATDRYRLATTVVRSARVGAGTWVSVPVAVVDAIVGAAPAGPVRILPVEDKVVASWTGGSAAAPGAGDYPDVWSVLHELPDGPVLTLDPIRTDLGTANDAADTTAVELAGPGGPVRVDRDLLCDALAQVPGGTVVLPGPGVIAPLAIRDDDAGRLALVMPLGEPADPGAITGTAAG